MQKDARPAASGWRIEGLPAAGPAEGMEKELALFGQFVGSWTIVRRRLPGPPPKVEGHPGEVHFNWVLGGRAVQDVWASRDHATGALDTWGTTVRYYDASIRAWRSTWIAPRQSHVRRFIGRRVGREIVLKEEDRGTLTERWVFADIRRDSFRWYALKRRRVGSPWEVVEEMWIERRPG